MDLKCESKSIYFSLFIFLSLVSIQSSSFLQISCSKLLHRFYLLTCFLNFCPHQYTTSKAMTVSLVPTAIGQTPLKMSESRMIPLPCLKKSGQGRGSDNQYGCSVLSDLSPAVHKYGPVLSWLNNYQPFQILLDEHWVYPRPKRPVRPMNF